MQNKSATLPSLKLVTLAVALACVNGQAHAFRLSTDEPWDVHVDTTVQYTAGWRAQGREDAIGNHPFFAEGDYKFDKGDMVTNRVQALFEVEGVYDGHSGYRLTG